MVDTEGEGIQYKNLNMHRLGMEMIMRADTMTHSGNYVRKLLLYS